MTPGELFRTAVKKEQPLQVVGVINAYVALMAERCGFQALYLSGAGVANSSYGVPDIGLMTLDNVLEDASRIINAVNLPLLVDIDTGWDGKAIKAMIRAGVAAVHLEDQVAIDKKCGHLEGKKIVSKEEMVDRIKAAVDARTDPSFVIMARTDAFASEGLERTIERAIAYRDAGADMIFPEALTELAQFETLRKKVGVPILCNLTEFGKTPLWSTKELRVHGIDMALYPLSANRAMNAAALKILKEIKEKGTQKGALSHMQTREELYDFLNYKGT